MAGQASRENGKKGGRPKGYPALEAERARLMIAEKLATEFEPILDKAIEQAKEGNKDARDWVTERAYGKPIQPIDLNNKISLDEETIDKARSAVRKYIRGDLGAGKPEGR